VFVHLFARCTIEPNVVDGHAVYPNIEKGVNAGVIFAPEHYHVKFVKRQNALV
jgi:hypothetical protein